MNSFLFGRGLLSRSALYNARRLNLAQRLRPSSTLASLPAPPQTQAWTPTPYITETTGGTHFTYDVFSRLLKERIIMLQGSVDDQSSAAIVAMLLYLEADNPEKPISLYINSPGGSVTAGLAIYDTMQYIQSEVQTICLGQAASMGSLLLCGGAPGKRYCLPHSSIMVHQPSGGYAGTATDIAIHAQQILKVREQLNNIYSVHLAAAGKPLSLDEINKMLERDKFMSAQESLEMGLVDEILDRRPVRKADGKAS